MCANHQTQPRILDQSFFYYLGAVCLGLLTGYANIGGLHSAATIVSDLFINLLKLVSLPIIFLSIISTASSMKNVDEIKFLGLKVVRLTLLTTVLAATIALAMFWLWDPVNGPLING